MALSKKIYKDYSEYIEHQKSKLDKEIGWISRWDKKYTEILKERLLDNFIKLDIEKGNVLCLGARLGGEVRAFIEINCFAVGIDLNPGKDNKYVLYGDFHDIQFPSKSVNIVFTNSLDHVFDIDKFFDEIKRVLKPGGYLIMEIAKGGKPGPYEAISWKNIDDIIKVIEKYGFELIKKFNIDYPDEGEHCIFKEKLK